MAQMEHIVMDATEQAAALRHYGLEMIKLAADLEATARLTAGYVCGRCNQETSRLLSCLYQDAEIRVCPTCANEIVPLTSRDGNGRLRCCGAGPDRRDPRTGEDLHLPGCHVAATL